MSRQFTSISEMIDFAESINFKSLAITDESGNTLVNGANTTNPWENNKREIEQFLIAADKPYNILARKGPRTSPEKWLYTPSNEKPAEKPMQMRSGISMSEYTKVLNEKYKAESDLAIEKAKSLSLETELKRLRAEMNLSDELEDENANEKVDNTVVGFVKGLYDDNKEAINPIFTMLADKLVNIVSGDNENLDDATYQAINLSLKKAKNMPISQIEAGVLGGYWNKFGPKTQTILSELFQ